MTRSGNAPRRWLQLGLMASAATLAASGAHAQTSPAPEQPAELGEIVVTAQRREERLQDVPAAISAFQGAQLERLGISGTTQLTQITPGLNFTQSVFLPQPTIRGIGTRGAGAGDESVVPIYIDGVYQAFIPSLDLQFNNIERIEVLKGPQGALLGRNATGGAVNILTRTPTATPAVRASVRYGRFNEFVGKAYLAGGTDLVAADLAVVGSRDDGYIEDPLRNDTYAGMEGIAVRSKVVFHPVDQFDLTLAASYSNTVASMGMAYNSYQGNTIARRIPGNPVTTEDFVSRLSYHPYNKVHQFSVALTGVWRAEAFDLTALTSYQENRAKFKADSDASPLELSTTYWWQGSEPQYNEIYAVSNGEGPFSWIVGAVYYHDVAGNPFSNTYTRSVSATGVVGPLVHTNFRSKLETKSYAAYVQGAYAFTPALSATIGGRYTQEEKAIHNVVLLPSLLNLTNSGTFEKFTPSLTVKYQPNPDLNLYAKAGQGFKAGIFNANATSTAAIQLIRPEEVTQYEVGVKAKVSPTVRLDVAAYYTDYKDLQSTARDPVSFTSILQNAGSAELYGVEAEVFVNPIDNLNIRVGVAALHGEYKDFQGAQFLYPITTNDPVATAANPAAACAMGTGTPLGGNRSVFCDASGKKIIRTPFLTANLGGDYLIPIQSGDITISANLSYQGKSYWDVLNRVPQPARTVLNARAAWSSEDGRYGAAIWGENLTDEVYPLTRSISTAGDNQALARPRTYGVELTYDF